MGAPFGVLQDTKIHELYERGYILSDINPQIGTCDTELSASVRGEPVAIEDGDSAVIELGQRIAGRYRKLGELYPVGCGKSSSAKAGADVELLGEDGMPVTKGYKGMLYARVTARGKHPIEIWPGDPIANLRFYRGHPEECILDPFDVILMTSKLHKSGEPEIEDNRLIMRLGLGNHAKPAGYSAKRTGKTARLHFRSNRKEDFFGPIYTCSSYDAMKGDFLLLRTYKELCIDPKTDVPFVARMPRVNMHGQQVNLAEFIKYGCGPHHTIIEMPIDEDTTLLHRQPICEMVFERMHGKPKNTYNGLGHRNNSTITGTFFY